MATSSGTLDFNSLYAKIINLVHKQYADVIINVGNDYGGDYTTFRIRQRGSRKEVTYKLSGTEAVMLSSHQIVTRLCDIIRSNFYGEISLEESVNEVLSGSTGNEWVDSWLKKQEAK